MINQLKITARWEIRNDIGIITLDNPPENYLENPEFIPLELIRKWTSYNYLKGVMITGGGKHFPVAGSWRTF